MKWLRLYSEARTDAKLESLPDDEFRVWHRLLCFANDQPTRGTIAQFSPRLLAVEVAKGNVELLERTLNSLQELHIIEICESGYHFVHWESRQYASDNVSLRVAQHRERSKQKDVTLQERFTEVTVTPPETEADPETETDPHDHAIPLLGGKGEKATPQNGASAPASVPKPDTQKKPTRKRRQHPWDDIEDDDPILLALLEVCYPQKPSKVEQERAKEHALGLRTSQGEVSPDEIRRRAENYRHNMPDYIPLTPRALANNWSKSDARKVRSDTYASPAYANGHRTIQQAPKGDYVGYRDDDI